MTSGVVLDSAAAVLRARAAIGFADGAGACLANVYKWFGSVQSTGAGSGHYATAIQGWNYAEHKLEGISEPPAGIPVYFGIDTPRTDRNASAGDVTLSIGGGYVIATDSPATGTPGIMSIAARAAQTQRNYLGACLDFLGHDTTAGLAYADDAHPPLIVTGVTRKDTDMLLLKNTNTGDVFLVGQEYIKHISTTTEVNYLKSNFTFKSYNKTAAAYLLDGLGIPTKYVSAKVLVKEYPGGLWSRALASAA